MRNVRRTLPERNGDLRTVADANSRNAPEVAHRHYFAAAASGRRNSTGRHATAGGREDRIRPLPESGAAPLFRKEGGGAQSDESLGSRPSTTEAGADGAVARVYALAQRFGPAAAVRQRPGGRDRAAWSGTDDGTTETASAPRKTRVRSTESRESFERGRFGAVVGMDPAVRAAADPARAQGPEVGARLRLRSDRRPASPVPRPAT